MTYRALHADTTIRKRRLSKPQRSALETAFAVHPFPNITTIKELAFQTGLTMTKVHKWFANTRYKTRQGKFVGEQSIHVGECVYTCI